MPGIRAAKRLSRRDFVLIAQRFIAGKDVVFISEVPVGTAGKWMRETILSSLPDSKHRLFKSFNCLQLELEVAGWFLIRALAKTKNIVFPYGFSRRWSTRIWLKPIEILFDLISAKAADAIQT